MCYTDPYVHIKNGIRKDRSTIGCKHQERSILDLPVTLGRWFIEKKQEDFKSEIRAGSEIQCMLGRQKLS